MSNVLNKLANKAVRGISKHSPDILLASGIASGLASTILAVKATPKALMLIEEKKVEKRRNMEETDNLTKKEIVKAAWKPYIPAAISAVTGVTCILGARSVNAKRSAAVATAFKLTETAFNEYKEAVIEEIGTKKEANVRERVARKHTVEYPATETNIESTGKGNTMFFDEEFNNYFYSDMQAVKKAVNDLNYQILNEDYASVNDLYYLLGIKPMKSGDDLGWSSAYGGLKVKYNTILTENDVPCVVLEYDIAPRYDYSKLMWYAENTHYIMET